MQISSASFVRATSDADPKVGTNASLSQGNSSSSITVQLAVPQPLKQDATWQKKATLPACVFLILPLLRELFAKKCRAIASRDA
eukprot:6481258-Amphidinium_carterae.2